MTAKPPFRRLARVLALALSLGALAAALTGATQTLAQTHRPTCSTSGAHAAKAKSHASACATHKGRPHHADKRRGKHGHAKTKGKGKSGSHGSHHPATARCEDGGAPALADEGSFACEDGSEPECEDGATPTPASDGKSLVCPPSSEREAGAGEAECEEDEEEETSCTGEPSPQACEATDPQCKAEG